MRRPEILKDHERLDDLHIKNLHLIQNPKMFCFGVDAVLLSFFAKANKGDQVLDLGTGNGIIPILMSAKYEGTTYTGLEIQEKNVDMARRSLIYNDLTNSIEFIQGDIKEATGSLPLSHYDIVTSNPPYMSTGKALQSAFSPKAIARHELLCTLEDVIYAAGKLVRVGGRFCMIHRPSRLVEIFEVLRKYQLEPKRMRMIHSKSGDDATLVLIESVRGGKAQLTVEPPLFIYDNEGNYTEAIYEIYGYDR